MPSFSEYFKANMNATGLPAPSDLFSTATTAISTVGSINSAIEKFGTQVTIGELIEAGLISEKLAFAGALTASFYAGAVIGSIGVATAKCIADGISPDAPPANAAPYTPTDPMGNPQPGGGASSDDPGGGGCVSVESWLPSGSKAGEVKVGSALQLAHEATLEPALGEVTYSQRKMQPGYRITTQSGISLVCSSTAPIPTRDGLVLAPELVGKKVPTRRDNPDGSFMTSWETVEVVTSVGPIEAQHITVGDRCFWAGEQQGCYILHHNMKAEPDPDDPGDPGDDDWRANRGTNVAQQRKAITPSEVHASARIDQLSASLNSAMAGFVKAESLDAGNTAVHHRSQSPQLLPPQ